MTGSRYIGDGADAPQKHPENWDRTIDVNRDL